VESIDEAWGVRGRGGGRMLDFCPWILTTLLRAGRPCEIGCRADETGDAVAVKDTLPGWNSGES
jgi:hypothetical protein